MLSWCYEIKFRNTFRETEGEVMRSMRVGRMARLALATCLAMVLAVMVLAGCAQQTNGAGGEAAAAGDETTVTVTDLRG